MTVAPQKETHETGLPLWATSQLFYARFQVGRNNTPTPIVLNLRPNSFKRVTQKVQIPAEVVDGCCICAGISVTEQRKPFVPYTDSWLCASKGEEGASAVSRVLTPAEVLRMRLGLGR